jgi:beta-N-acetylhexosaminidase
VAARARAADLVLFIADVRVRAGKGTVSLDAPAAAMLRELALTRPVVLVSLGNPYLLQQAPEVGSYLIGWGADVASQRAVARALLGRAPITGRIPIAIPPLHERGAGQDRPARLGDGGDMGVAGADAATVAAIDAAIEEAIDRRITPGAVVAIGRRSGLLHLRGYGATDYAPGAPPATGSTLYDIASLTKVVGTTTAVMRLVDQGRMGLDDPLHRHLDAWPGGGWRDDVTIRRLLSHSSGLVPFVRFWHPSGGSLQGRDAVISAIAALPAAYPPGSRMTYSDLGFILLAAAVEQVTGEPLDVALQPVWVDLGMSDTGFLPLRRAPLERIAPTEIDTVLRHGHVHGVVHDENAYIMGGVAGHAGIFSSAVDLARFARHLMRAMDGEGPLSVGPATVERFTVRDPATGRTLGWEAAPGSGRIAEALSHRAFGHTGFTGTSLWIDPDRDLFVVLLTNRVNPTREGSGIQALRRQLHALASDI